MTGHHVRESVAGLALAVLLAPVLGCGDPGETREPEQAFRRRAAAAERESPTEALALYRDAQRRYPTEAWPFAGYGRLSRELGRTREAEDAFRQAVRWDSTRADTRVALAEVLLDRGRPEEALGWLRTVLGDSANAAWPLSLEGRALASLGRTGEAEKALARAERLAPDDPRVAAEVTRHAISADSADVTVARLDELVSRWPDSPDIRLARADALVACGRVDEALEELGRALDVAPGRARIHRAIARLAANRGDSTRAREQWSAILTTSPNDAEALEGFGECALASGDERAAEEAFRRAIEADPDLATPYLALGRFLARRDRRDEAIAALRKGRARAALEPEIWRECSRELGELHLALGEGGNALEVADAMLGRDPDDEDARELRGRALAAGGGGSVAPDELERSASRPEASEREILAYVDWLLANGDADRAWTVTSDWLGRHPGDPRARIRRARANLARGFEDEGEAELHDVLGAHEDLAEAHATLARLYLERSRLPDARFHASEGARLAPEDAEFPVLEGRIAMREARWDDARTAFERVLELRPEEADAWLGLGRLHLERGRAAEAVECFQKARDLDEGDWQAPYLLGLAETNVGRPRDAVVAYRMALARNERLVEAHNNLAWLLADLDLDPVLAEVHARRAAELDPDNPNVLGTLGWALYKNRSLASAELNLAKATLLRPEDPVKRYLHAVVLFHQGRTEDSRREVTRALELSGDFPEADRARELLRLIEG
ncbi:MAG: tetratricopeptide repeat protein [bacterium]